MCTHAIVPCSLLYKLRRIEVVVASCEKPGVLHIITSYISCDPYIM